MMGISAFRPHFFDGFRMQITDAFSPVLSTVSLPFQHAALFFHGVTELAQQQADVKRLEDENERLREWYQAALLLESENTSLRSLLNFESDPKLETITGRIIADQGNTYVKSLLVNIGRKQGVKKDAAVLAGQGLVGRVIDVGDDTSRILLVTDINARVPIMVNDTGQHAIMAGVNAGVPKLIHLPQDSEVIVGSRIVTSGYGGVFPYGLPVGRVIRLENGALGVALFSDFEALQIVRLLQFNEDI